MKFWDGFITTVLGLFCVMVIGTIGMTFYAAFAIMFEIIFKVKLL